MAMSLDSSSESMASFRNFSAASVDRLGPYPYHNLVGNTASAPYTMKNGVKLVDQGHCKQVPVYRGDLGHPFPDSGAKPEVDILALLSEDAGV
jgi:hypothetical protein